MRLGGARVLRGSFEHPLRGAPLNSAKPQYRTEHSTLLADCFCRYRNHPYRRRHFHLGDNDNDYDYDLSYNEERNNFTAAR